MQKLLPVALLLAGCTLSQAHAQKAQVPPPTAAAATPSPAPALHWAAAEFCEAYAHYYPTLPSLYRYNAGQALHNTPLAAPNADVAALLLHQLALREAVYQTLYQYCHTLKYGLDNSSEVEDLVHQFLHQNLHMSDLAATYLAPQITRRYQQPAPPSLVKEATLVTTRGDSHAGEQPRILYTPKGSGGMNAPALNGAPDSRRRTANYGGGLELNGWQFDTAPAVAVVEDNPGVIRFRIEVADNGEVESVMKVSGNVSPAQERLCRDKLLNMHFVKTNAGASATTGFYTFRITVR